MLLCLDLLLCFFEDLSELESTGVVRVILGSNLAASCLAVVITGVVCAVKKNTIVQKVIANKIIFFIL